jgi:hypothetical protein
VRPELPAWPVLAPFRRGERTHVDGVIRLSAEEAAPLIEAGLIAAPAPTASPEPAPEPARPRRRRSSAP